MSCIGWSYSFLEDFFICFPFLWRLFGGCWWKVTSQIYAKRLDVWGIYGTSEVAVNFIVTLDDTPTQLYKASCTVSIGPDGKGICLYLWSIRIALKSGPYPSGNTWALDILRHFFFAQMDTAGAARVWQCVLGRYPASVFNLLNPLEGVRLTIFPHKMCRPGSQQEIPWPGTLMGQVRERQHEGYSDYRLRVETKEGIIDEEPP